MLVPRSRGVRLLGALLVTAVAVLGIGACGSSQELSIAEAWARSTPDGQTRSAAYMVITGGQEADRLVKAAVPTTIAATTEIHETVMATEGEADGMDEGGMGDGDASGEMTMRPVDGIDVPADGSVELKPGGYHVMFMDLAMPLAAGDTFELTLTFEKAGEKVVTVTVKDA
jgi:hypothetical protein